MKTTIKFIIAISVIFCNIFCNAQTINTPAQWLAYQQKELKECPYIFEGKIIQQIRKGNQLTCSVMQITKIYRGSPQLKLGTIKVITTIIRGSEKFPQLINGHSYVIFANWLSNTTAFQSVSTDNILMPQTNDWVTFTGAGAVWGVRKITQYKTLDSLYSFFQENGLTVEQEAPTDSTMKK